MRPSKQFCKSQIERMEGLPYYAAIGPHGFQELVNTLQGSSPCEESAKAAVDAILSDTSRASSPETNRVPSPGELIIWLKSQREDQYDSPSNYSGRHCPRCENGRPPGWITFTVTAHGLPYAFAGKCPDCNPGWYSRSEAK